MAKAGPNSRESKRCTFADEPQDSTGAKEMEFIDSSSMPERVRKQKE